MDSFLLEQVREHKIVAAFRGVSQEKAAKTAQTLYKGGLRLLEVTFNQKDPGRIKETSALIQTVLEQTGNEMCVGAGTVLTVEEVNAAAKAGATFLLAPNLNEAVVYRAKELGLGVIPGAFSPTEIVQAYSLGADLVKVFPAENLGVSYFKALKGPLGHIPLLAMGGVNRENLKDFLKVVDGVGIGSNLVDTALINQDRWDDLEALARSYTGVTAG